MLFMGDAFGKDEAVPVSSTSLALYGTLLLDLSYYRSVPWAPARAGDDGLLPLRRSKWNEQDLHSK